MGCAMARMIPSEGRPRGEGGAVGTADRRLFDRLVRELDDSWQILQHCEVRARGESGTIPFVLLHRDLGIALLAVGDMDAEDDYELPAEAMRVMLAEIGFRRRFGNRLAIVARSVQPDSVPDFPALIAALFAERPPTAIADPSWTEWLLPHLAPPPAAAAPASAPRLRAPQREEAWQVGQVTPRAAETVVEVAPERILRSADLELRSPLWKGMALAIVVVAAVLVGLHAISHDAPPVAPTQLGMQ
jgi:hypothetical protein